MRLRSSIRRDRSGMQWVASPAAHGEVVAQQPRTLDATRPSASPDYPGFGEQRTASRSVQAAILAAHRTSSGAPSVFVAAACREGATFASDAILSLARSLATLGYRTLIASARRGGSGISGFDTPEEPAAFAGLGALDGLTLQSGGVPDLSALRLGDMFPRLAEDIDRGGMTPALRAAAAQFDIVLIDSEGLGPEPLGGLAAGSDGVVVFVRRHHTRLSDLDSVIFNVRERNAQVLGVVLI